MELFAADGHDAGGCERVTGKSGMRPPLVSSTLVRRSGCVPVPTTREESFERAFELRHALAVFTEFLVHSVESLVHW